MTVSLTVRRRCSGLTCPSGAGDRPYGVDMSHKQNWKVAHLDEIERRGRDSRAARAPRDHSFGINALTPDEDGKLMMSTTRSARARKSCTSWWTEGDLSRSTADDRRRDAPVGGPEARRKATGSRTVLDGSGDTRELYQAVDWGGCSACRRDVECLRRTATTPMRPERSGRAGSSGRRTSRVEGSSPFRALQETRGGRRASSVSARSEQTAFFLPRFRDDARRDDDFADCTRRPAA